MPTQEYGTSGALQSLTGDLTTIVVYVTSIGAVTDPDNASGVNIRVTRSLADESQKNFEVLVQSIGLRAMPVIMNDPQATMDLSILGAPTLTGEGFRWVFSVEVDDVFSTYANDGTENTTGLLVEELNGIVMPSAVILDTSPGGNIEFVRQDLI